MEIRRFRKNPSLAAAPASRVLNGMDMYIGPILEDLLILCHSASSQKTQRLGYVVLRRSAGVPRSNRCLLCLKQLASSVPLPLGEGSNFCAWLIQQQQVERACVSLFLSVSVSGHVPDRRLFIRLKAPPRLQYLCGGPKRNDNAEYSNNQAGS